MDDTKLEADLRLMVRRYGFEQVDRSLREIGLSGRQFETSNQHPTSANKVAAAKPVKKGAKVTATEYVLKLELPLEQKPAVVELAERFQDKSFLPTFGDIANFCRIYGIDEPASRSRSSAIPRVFKFIATMETNEIQRILDDGMFSGPSRLGPIADAIRSNGRSSAAYTSTT